jgi:dienelactone hydrolase
MKLTKKLVWYILSLSCSGSVFSQKPVIDTGAIRTWTAVGNPKITDNGSYFLYVVNNRPVESTTSIFQSTDGHWKKEFIGVSRASFAGDNKGVFLNNDTLCFLSLGAEEINTVPGVISYKMPENSEVPWMAYERNNSDKELVLVNLASGKKQVLDSVKDYSFSDDGSVLLLRCALVGNTDLHFIDLRSGKDAVIWVSNASRIVNMRLATDGSQLVFMVEETTESASSNSIWYYKRGMDKAVMKVNDRTRGIDPFLSVQDGNLAFSKNDRWIYFDLEEHPKLPEVNPESAKVNVWSYKDSILQSVQLGNQDPVSFQAAIRVQGDSVERLEQREEMAFPFSKTGDYVVVRDRAFEYEPSAKAPVPRSFYLVSLLNGSRTFLGREGEIRDNLFSFSPDDKFLVYYDNKAGGYASYEIGSGEVRNITGGIETHLYNEYVKGEPIPVGIAGWLNHGDAVLIYDENDIWEVDPSGEKRPINVTNGYGRLKHIKFALVDEPENVGETIRNGEPILLSGFNTENKDNGFYRKSMTEKGDPMLLTMGPYIYYINTRIQTPGFRNEVGTMQPLKARRARSWVVERMSAEEAPNFYLTKDFKVYKALTDLQPQKRYNWLTSELVTWKQFDGTSSQGILYKPENFDPHKKYPIIFNYYERLSYDLHAFVDPGLTENEINIAWFVSRGYLLFRPDIHFSISIISNVTNGENAYNSVVSAAEYLERKTWVDSSRMGLDGHSFGGAMTNYLVTHTNIFTAAAEAAGAVDAISSNLSLAGYPGKFGSSRLAGNSFDQGRMGVSIWDRPDLYIRNSSILKADNVTTPLLMMHNMKDVAVPWGQAMELFLALRYLGRAVWLLQYEDGGHSISGKDALDYTIRITQFYDHYLKGMPAPKWMVEGIPAARKGIDDGLQLEPAGVEPGPGLLISKGQ